MKDLLNFGQMLAVHGRLSPDRIGARDLERSMTFPQWNERSCRLANALLGLGLSKGDRVAVLGLQLRRVVRNLRCDRQGRPCRVADQLPPDQQGSPVYRRECRGLGPDRPGRTRRPCRGGPQDLPIKPDRFIHFGARPCPAGYRAYEDFLVAGSAQRTRAARSAVRSMDADVHLGHYRQSQGRGAKPSQRRAAVDGDRDRTWPASQRRRLAGDADVPRQLAQFLWRLRLLRRRLTSIYSRKSFDPEHCVRDARGRRLDIHVAGADPLHHDAGVARCGAAADTISAE